MQNMCRYEICNNTKIPGLKNLVDALKFPRYNADSRYRKERPMIFLPPLFWIAWILGIVLVGIYIGGKMVAAEESDRIERRKYRSLR